MFSQSDKNAGTFGDGGTNSMWPPPLLTKIAAMLYKRSAKGWKAANLRSRLWPIHALQRKKFEVILLIEPRAFEIPKREIGPSSERKRIDGKLNVSVLLLPGVRLVIEDLQVSVANLQKIDVARDEIAFEVERESPVAVVGDVLLREIHGNFDCDGRGVVHEHEPLECFMAFLVCACRGEHERRKPRCVIFFPRDWNRDRRGKFGRAVFSCLKHAVREILSDSFKIVLRTGKMAMASVLKQEFEFRLMELETVHLLVA